MHTHSESREVVVFYKLNLEANCQGNLTYYPFRSSPLIYKSRCKAPGLFPGRKSASKSLFVPTTTYLRNNKSFISSSRWILAVLEFEPSPRRWGGGGGARLPHAQRTQIQSLIRYPATAEQTAHLVLPFSFLVFGVL